MLLERKKSHLREFHSGSLCPLCPRLKKNCFIAVFFSLPLLLRDAINLPREFYLQIIIQYNYHMQSCPRYSRFINRVSSQHSPQLLHLHLSPPQPLWVSELALYASPHLLYCWFKRRTGVVSVKGFFSPGSCDFLFLSHVCVCVCVFIYYKTGDDFISAAQHTLYTVH